MSRDPSSPPPLPAVRVLAGSVLVLTAFGTAALLSAARGTPGYQLDDYLSEMGIPGEPYAGTYQLSVRSVVAAMLLLGTTLSMVLRTIAPLAALVVSAALLIGSVQVPCTPGCPVPPWGPGFTGQDVLHLVVSAGGLGMAAIAMVLVAGTERAGPMLRVGSLAAGGLTLGCMAVTGAALLVRPHGVVHGLFERGAVAVALGWVVLVATGLLVCRPRVVSPMRVHESTAAATVRG